MPTEGNRFRVGDAEIPAEFGKYLSMHRALGNRARYEILWILLQNGEMSLDAIENELAVDDDENVADHIETLCDAFLVKRWKKTEHGSTEMSTTYQPTVYGRIALTDGIHELIRSEGEVSEMYNSDYEETNS